MTFVDPITRIGEIKMRSPSGAKSTIAVDRTDKGGVTIRFSRSSEGEALMMLNASTARELGDLLIAAVSPSPSIIPWPGHERLRNRAETKD